MATAESDPDSAYTELLDRRKRIANVQNAGMVLYWDQQTKMPEGGTPARAKQLGALQSIAHELLTDERTGELLDELESTELDDEQIAVVREVRREYDRAVAIPNDLVERISETSSEAQPAWREAKAEDEFETFAPYLDQIRELHIEMAEHIDPEEDPYVVMFEGSEPYLPLSRVEEIFDELREGLVPLIEDVHENGADIADDAFAGTFDAEDQEALVGTHSTC